MRIDLWFLVGQVGRGGGVSYIASYTSKVVPLTATAWRMSYRDCAQAVMSAVKLWGTS